MDLKKRLVAIFGGGGAIWAVAHALNLSLILGFGEVLWANAGPMFTAFSVAASTIAPQIPWLPAGVVRTGAIAFGALFILTIAERVYDSVEKRLTKLR